MGNDSDTTLERLDGLDEGSERLAVQEVSGLIEDDDVRSAPSSGSEYNLNLLTTRKTAHGVVRGKFTLETEVLEVLLDLLTNKRTVHTEL